MQLFGRNVILQIGNEADGIEIKNNLKIEFSITKLINANSSEGTISIYNINDSTKKFIQEKTTPVIINGEPKSQPTRARLLVGYGDEVSLLYDGQIDRNIATDDGANRLQHLYFGGLVYSTNAAIFSKSYQNSISIRQIISDALPTIPLTFDKKITDIIPENATIPNFSYSGKTTEVFDALLNPLDIQWFEDKGQLLFSKKGKSINIAGEEATVLNSNTGLIKTALQTDRGVNATCLLNPRLTVGSLVKIESDVIQNSSFNQYFTFKKGDNTDGFYKIIQATYAGDNWDGKFEALIQCVPVNENSIN